MLGQVVVLKLTLELCERLLNADALQGQHPIGPDRQVLPDATEDNLGPLQVATLQNNQKLARAKLKHHVGLTQVLHQFSPWLVGTGVQQQKRNRAHRREGPRLGARACKAV